MLEIILRNLKIKLDIIVLFVQIKKYLQNNSIKVWFTVFKNANNNYELDLTGKLNLKNPKNNKDLANLSIYYTWKNIKSEYKNNKFKISARTWKETFDLPDVSYSIDGI